MSKMEMLTVEEAARVLDCHPDLIRKLCRSGKINCKKFGYVWAIVPSSLEDYQNRPRQKPGPKPKKEPGIEPGSEV